MRRFAASDWPRLVAPRRLALAEPDHYVNAFDWPQGARVADIGAGPGFFTEAIRRAIGPGGSVIAVDAQVEMLRILGERCAPCARVAGLLTALPLADSSVDVAWCAFVFHEVADVDAAARELYRVLASAGRALVLDWEPRPTDHGPPAEERLGPRVVEHALQSAGFRVEGPTAVTSSQWALVGQK